MRDVDLYPQVQYKKKVITRLRGFQHLAVKTALSTMLYRKSLNDYFFSLVVILWYAIGVLHYFGHGHAGILDADVEDALDLGGIRTLGKSKTEPSETI